MAEIMKKLADKMEQLRKIKEEATPDFLRGVSMSELKTKLEKIDGIVKNFKELWDSTDFDNYPEEETIGFETKKQEVMELREEVAKPYEDKIEELIKLEEKSERDGEAATSSKMGTAQALTATDPPQKAADQQAVPNPITIQLNEIFNKLTEGKSQITTHYLETAAAQQIQAKEKQLSGLHGEYIAKFLTLTEPLKTQTTKQKEDVTKLIQEIQTLLKDEITKRWQNAQDKKREAEEAKTKEIEDAKSNLNQEKEAHQKTESERKKLEESRNLTLSELELLKREFEQEKLNAAKIAKENEQRIRNLETLISGVKLSNDPQPSTSHAIAFEGRDESDSDDDQLGFSLFNSSQMDYADGDPPAKSDDTPKPDPPPNPKPVNNTTTMQLKLDSIKLPFFNGELTEWIAFKDLFEYLVHTNTGFSDTLKFHQLRTHLRGTALETIKGYQLTGANYESAWKDLKMRFDRKDEIIQEYIRRFLEVPAITFRPTFSKLRAIVDSTNQMLRALPSLGAKVKDWDPFILLIIMTKLDEESRFDWKKHIGRRDKIKVSNLIEFLELKAIDLQPNQGDHLSQMLKGEKGCQRKIFQINEKSSHKGKKECPLCKGDHYIWHCSKLKKECAKVRTDIIRTLKVCFKCLLKHEIGLCSKEDCPYCGGPHNVLLCFKKERDQQRSKYQVRPQTQYQHHSHTSPSNNQVKQQWTPQPKPSTSKDNGWDDDEDWGYDTKKNPKK